MKSESKRILSAINKKGYVKIHSTSATNKTFLAIKNNNLNIEIIDNGFIKITNNEKITKI